MGTTYYVSGTGNDNNDGLKETSAFRNLQTAADRLQPGDTLLVMDGTYTQSDPNKELMVVWNKNGSEDKWTTIKAYPGHAPKLKVKGSYGINVVGSSYVRIEGLDLEGSKDEISLDYAQNEKNNWDNPLTNSSGIGINPSYNGSEIDNNSHHIVISDNKVHDFTAAGIGSYKADYVTIENNDISGNAWYTPRGNSGIHVVYNWNSDNNTTDYKFIIRDNIIYDNQSLVEWSGAGEITEGHGIIIDDSLNTQENSTGEPYNGKTLVANNTVYNNGGFGINSYSSSNIDIVNNTTYQNSDNPGNRHLNGEIAVMNSKNVRAYNNIMYARSDRRANTIYDSENVTFDRNLVYNSSDFKASDNPDAEGLQNTLGKDPLFADPSQGDFTLQSGSPAIDAGSGTFNGAIKTDQLGTDRPQDGDGNGSEIIDLGALELGTQSASSGNGTVLGVSKSPSSITEGTEDETLTATKDSNQILSNEGNNTLYNSSEPDVLTGGDGADRFVLNGNNQRDALSQSQVGTPDRITNFNPAQGDRIRLNYDRNLSTIERPQKLFNVGDVKGHNLSTAIKNAYADKDLRAQGNQQLDSNEAVLFRYRGGTYLSVNDRDKPFDASRDLVVNVTGMTMPNQNTTTGSLNPASYFA